jgi:hypothetical protein
VGFSGESEILENPTGRFGTGDNNLTAGIAQLDNHLDLNLP